MATHTPGPWRWMNDDTLVADYGHRNVVLTSGLGSTLQTRGKNGRLRQLKLNDPDARLMAAAPDLLQLVREAIAIIDEAGGADVEPLDQRDWLKTARAALAKAVGAETAEVA
jgi:hypothetical protein